MNNALKYFLSPSENLWRWHGDFIEWNCQRDATLCPFAEVRQFLIVGSFKQLPPLTSLVVVVAALRQNWNRVSVQAVFSDVNDHFGLYLQDVIEKVFEHLDFLHKKASILRGQKHLAAAVCRHLFSGLEAEPGFLDARPVMNLLEEGVTPQALTSLIAKESSEEFSMSMRILLRALNGFPVENLEHVLLTGVSLPVSAVEVEIPVVNRMSLSSLLADDSLQNVGRLVQQLLAVVNLPRRIEESYDLPVGGISDVSNKGHLDRLLLSELAQDNETLSVRLAGNEALYYKRETPQSSELSRSAIFLDNGIRYWGRARLLADALAVTLRLKKLEGEEFQLFLQEKGLFRSLPFDQQNDISALMQKLDHGLSPLPAFRQYFSSDMGVLHRVFLIVHEKSVSSELLELLRSQWPEFYLCLIGDDGDLEVQCIQRRGRLVLVKVKVDLEEILNRQAVVEEVVAEKNDGLPEFYGYLPLPLKSAYRSEALWVDRHGRDFLFVTHSGQLMLQENGGRFYTLLSCSMPLGDVRTSLVPGMAFCAGLSGTQLQLVSVDLKSRQIETSILSDNECEFYFSRDCLVFGEKRLDLKSGEVFELKGLYPQMKKMQTLGNLNSGLLRFKGVDYRHDHLLFYIGRDRVFKFDFFGRIGRLETRPKVNELVRFGAVPGHPYLTKAVFASGSSVWQDEAGFIHLVSRHKGSVQICIQQRGQESFKIWLSDGRSNAAAVFLVGGESEFLEQSEASFVLEEFVGSLR